MNLNERINQAKALNTGLMLDKEDVRRLRVKAEPKPKKNTPLQKMIDDFGARKIVVAGFCHLNKRCVNSCPLYGFCFVGIGSWRDVRQDDINKLYEILTEEQR